MKAIYTLIILFIPFLGFGQFQGDIHTYHDTIAACYEEDICAECHLVLYDEIQTWKGELSSTEFLIGEFCGIELEDLESNGYFLENDIVVGTNTASAGYYEASNVYCIEHMDYLYLDYSWVFEYIENISGDIELDPGENYFFYFNNYDDGNGNMGAEYMVEYFLYYDYNPIITYDTITTCEENYVLGTEIILGGNDTYQTFVDTFFSETYCDSIVYTTIEFLQPTTSSLSIVACEFFEWNDTTLTESGEYFLQTVGSNGCDSTAFLNLQISSFPTSQDIIGETYVEPFSTLTYSLENNDNTYNWDVTNGNVLLSENSYVNIIWSDESFGTITVTETNSSGCFTTHSLYVNIAEPVFGCTDQLACNYDIDANEEDGSCEYLDGICESCVEGVIIDNDLDNDGICDEDEIAGCTDQLACNYDIDASDDDGSCYYITATISQNGDSLISNVNIESSIVDWYNVQSINDTVRYWLMAQNTSNFNPSFDCSYFIIASDVNCSVTSPIYYYSSEAKSIGSLFTSPNPTDGFVNVSFENNKNQFVKLYLSNNNGHILDEFITTNKEINIDLSSYPSGTYHISFNSPDSKDCLNENTFEKIANTIILR